VRDVTIPDHGGGFMDDGLVETRASASCLIDDVGGNPLTHEVWPPALAPVGILPQTRRRMRGPVHHDDRWHVLFPVRRYLELHVHLADRDLAGGRRLTRVVRLRRGIRGDLRYAADEEAALILDDQRFLEE